MIFEYLIKKIIENINLRALCIDKLQKKMYNFKVLNKLIYILYT